MTDPIEPPPSNFPEPYDTVSCDGEVLAGPIVAFMTKDDWN
jgi:hypothetical protein